MRKKFTYLISLLAAMICSSSGVAWGQLYNYWGNGCYCDNNQLGTYRPGCDEPVIIDGDRRMNFYNDTRANFTSAAHAANPKTAPAGASSQSSLGGNKTTYWVDASGDIKKTVWEAYWTSEPNQNCGPYNNSNCGDGTYAYREKDTDPAGNIFNIADCWVWDPDAHDHTPIDVLLSTVETNLEYVTPTWKHTQYTWSFNKNTGASVWTAGTPSTGNVNQGIIRTSTNGLRLTGGAPQIEKTGSIPTATLTFQSNRLLFDQEWDATTTWNGVTPSWNPLGTAALATTGTGTLGFYDKQENAVTKTGGILALGPCASRTGITVNTNDAALKVESYTYEAHNGLDCDDIHNTAESYGYGEGISTTINGNKLNITNSWWGCNAVNFCDAFTPTFSDAGPLVIDPNVTNFQAAVTLASPTGDVSIYSERITAASTFSYTSGGGNFYTKLSNQGTACGDCRYFDVTGALTTTSNGNIYIVGSTQNSGTPDVVTTTTATSGNETVSNVTVTTPTAIAEPTTYPNYNGTPHDGYFHAASTYTHTGSGADNLILMGGHIAIDGTAGITDDNTVINSKNSWINFGGAFTYSGATNLLVYAEGACPHVDNCNTIGGYVNFANTVGTTQTGAGRTTIESKQSYVNVGSTLTTSAVNGDLLIKANTKVNVTGAASLTRTGSGNDVIYSDGKIYFGSTFGYAPTSVGGQSGLSIISQGACGATYCDDGLLNPSNKGGSIWMEGAVTIANADNGFTKIEAANDSIHMQNTLDYTAGSGTSNLDILGQTGIGIVGNTNIDYSASGGGDAYIYSNAGYIREEGTFTYEDKVDANNLKMIANGECEGGCADGGYIWLNGAVDTKNGAGGTVLIQSNNSSVTMYDGFTHEGKTGSMKVQGESGVELLTKAVSITRNDEGNDAIIAPDGQIHVEKTFTYDQSASSADPNGNLLVNASATYNGTGSGICNFGCTGDPNAGLGGYIWLQDAVTTTNATDGFATFRSGGEFIRVDKPWVHTGVDSSLLILAEGNCEVDCGSLNSTTGSYLYRDAQTGSCGETGQVVEEGFLSAANAGAGINDAKTGRPDTYKQGGYVWFLDNMTSWTFSGNDHDGDVVIKSSSDIIQFDKDVNNPTDSKGSNFLLWGDKGIRTLGTTVLTNANYEDSPSGINSGTNGYAELLNSRTVYTVDSLPDTKGNVIYYSPNGFIDFGNTFAYTGNTDSVTLNIIGSSRVEFANTVTTTLGGSRGDVNVKAEKGFVSFQDTWTHTGDFGDINIFAKGNVIGQRSSLDSAHYCGDNGGFVHFAKAANITLSDSGKTWIRSDYDDVKMSDDFIYTNATTADPNGEFMMQAGQDIYGSNGEKEITFVQKGEKAILWEAKKTIHTKQPVTFTRENAISGNLILKAGYDSYADSANISTSVAAKGGWDVKGALCDLRGYPKRSQCMSMSGGDIWFEGLFSNTLSGAADTIQTIMRAYHSIFIDSTFLQDKQGTGVGGNTLLFAETGNVEAIVDGAITDVTFNIPATDNSELRIQAGNQVWNEGDTCTKATKFTSGAGGCDWNIGCADSAEYDGNILFDKPLNINHDGLGFTMLSSVRDIENQVRAPMTFTYTNTTLTDSVEITAGRHIETHSPIVFDYTAAGTNIGDHEYKGGYDDKVGAKGFDKGAFQILMQAGRLDPATTTGSITLCKATEEGTSLWDGTNPWQVEGTDVNPNTDDHFNSFAKGGKGQGSILMFNPVDFLYDGRSAIIMRALNGNIESDPYLHAGDSRLTKFNDVPGYDAAANKHNAKLTFVHGGDGVTRMEAIDIKLHDKITYDAYQPATSDSNGFFYMTAYDSILTRNIEYRNHTDRGNVYITTEKYKGVGASGCTGTYCTLGAHCGLDGLPIQQGHIVLGYGADCNSSDDSSNKNDSIIFDFDGNTQLMGANVYIQAGYRGYKDNSTKGQTKYTDFEFNADRNKGFGGNITFDYMKVDMAQGNHTIGGYMEISTPNGNIWGKDSINYHGHDGDLLVDAGVGSEEDGDAMRWNDPKTKCAGDKVNNTLNTQVPYTCDVPGQWRTGNIMMKGGSLNFAGDKGNAVFRTREGFIDTYDAFTVDSMQGDLLKYAGMTAVSDSNQWGDVSERDFKYTTMEGQNGSIYFGADDNIMMNYGYNNDESDGNMYHGRGDYDIAAAGLEGAVNPYYWTSYKQGIDACRAIYNVNEDGYMWYRHADWARNYHRLYRGCESDTQGHTGVCSAITGECKTIDNFARDLYFNFDVDAVNSNPITSGGLGLVATNYIDMFTKFTYLGGQGSGMGQVPGMSTLHGESVSGYGLYMKSQFNGRKVEKRRATCEGCDESKSFPMEGKSSQATYEWTYIGFHDDARIHTQNQKSLIEAPVVEFFGHAELDSYTDHGSKTRLTVKGDSLIFHDSAIFDGTALDLLPYTTGAQRQNDMRYGVINDGGKSSSYYKNYGPAIQMPDRNTPILEFGYQRCNEPPKAPQKAPNERSKAGFESTPMVGGDVIISFQHNFSLPIYNTIVANNARISFVSDSLDDKDGGEFVDTYIRTDLLRIRNKVEFYTGQNEFGKYGNDPKNRIGKFRLSSTEYQETMEQESGIFPRHLHMEPNSELSIPGEDTMKIYSMTTAGGYGNIHENISVVPNGTIAPGFASLMEYDCQTPHRQGQLTVHNLTMEKDAIFRISIGRNNPCYDEDGTIASMNCTATDTLIVQDTIWFNGKIPLHVLPETEVLDPGCYLFLEYGDSLGVSKEYVKNFTLPIDRFGDYYFGLDYSTPGKVYLCVMTFPQPIVQRYVKLPSVSGVTTTPNAGTHYVSGHQDFSFTASFSGAPLKVSATGYYNGEYRDLDYTAVAQPDGSYLYTIYQVVQPWEVKIGPEASTVGNEAIDGQKVWAYKNTLHINVDKSDIVSIYNLTGVLYKKIEVPEGNSKFTLDRGMYVVTLKDGSVYKIVIK